MISFSTLSRSAHVAFRDANFHVSHSQIQELISCGLGHRTYASFRQSDLHALSTCRHILFSYPSMSSRARDMGLPDITTDVCRSVFHGLVVGQKADQQLRKALRDVESFSLVVKLAFEDTPNGVKDQIALDLKGMRDGTYFNSCEPLGELVSDEVEWRWFGKGSVNVQCEDADFAAPVRAELSFPKLGRHLLGEPTISHLEKAGPPEYFEPDYEGDDYGSHSDSD